MSLGGKKTSETKIDPQLRDAALNNIAMTQKIGQIGYVPYTGDTVAGMQPGQIAAIESGNLGANAFGLPTMAVPTGANLNPYAAYEAALAKIPPAQRAFIESLFINSQTGAAPTMAYGAPVAQAAVAQQPYYTDGGGGGGGGGGGYVPGTGGGAADSGAAANRYTGLRDMINGGGPGASGSTFQGGILSSILNRPLASPVKARAK
jgi:hypothetical protein